MTDIYEQASEAEERDRALALKTQKERAARTALIQIGRCYFCEADVGVGRLFCDSDCRDDFELEQKRRR
jgi:hypothetical protein